jgi:hypothetical protein
MPPKPFDLTEPLAAAIRVLLFSEWDPCSVKLNAGCATEYDDYIPLIYGMAKKGESVVEIAARLNFIERSCMSLAPRKELNRAIAKRIVALAKAENKR